MRRATLRAFRLACAVVLSAFAVTADGEVLRVGMDTRRWTP
jgi:hypothetical protein